MGAENELRKTHGLPKRRWKNQFFQDKAFGTPHPHPHTTGSSAGDVRKLEEYHGSPGYLTGGKSPPGKADSGGQGHVFLGIGIFSNELFFKSFQGGSFTSFQPPFGI